MECCRLLGGRPRGELTRTVGHVVHQSVLSVERARHWSRAGSETRVLGWRSECDGWRGEGCLCSARAMGGEARCGEGGRWGDVRKRIRQTVSSDYRPHGGLQTKGICAIEREDLGGTHVYRPLRVGLFASRQVSGRRSRADLEERRPRGVHPKQTTRWKEHVDMRRRALGMGRERLSRKRGQRSAYVQVGRRGRADRRGVDCGITSSACTTDQAECQRRWREEA